MGTSPVPVDYPLVEVTEDYKAEVLEKRRLLEEDHHYYYQSNPSSMVAQWEALERVLTGLEEREAANFSINRTGSNVHFINLQLREETSFTIDDTSTLPFEPLDWIGRQVQEDLILLDNRSFLAAGQLCFPSGWCLDEKMNHHFLEIHAPLPERMNPMLQAADKLIERIPVNKPVARTNWGFRVNDQLDLSSRHGVAYRQTLKAVSSQLNDANTGDLIYFRIERQTLSRLPASGYVLFTIHTYISKLVDEIEDKGRAAAMLSYLNTVPADMLEYKQMTPFAAQLIKYLEKNLGNVA